MVALKDFIDSRYGFALGSKSTASRLEWAGHFNAQKKTISEGEKSRVKWIDQQESWQELEFLESIQDTGKVISLEKWADRDKRYTQLEMIDVAMAEKLEAVGLKGYSEGEPVSYVCLNTGTVKTKPNTAHNNLIPSRAAEKRKDLLNALIYFIEFTSKNPKVRFYNFCVHDGPRCLASDLVARWKIQRQNFRTWNKSEWAKRLGAFFIFRSNEAGSPVKKAEKKVWNQKKGVNERPYLRDDNGNRIPCLDKDGNQTWHPHSHAILMRTRYLEEDERAELMRRLQSHFNCVYPLQGEIANVRETCKYVVKSDELLNCENSAFLDYCNEVKGQRTVEAMGDFRKFRKALKDSGKKIRPIWDEEKGTSEMKLTRNWNRNPAKDVSEPTDGEQLERNIRAMEGQAGPLERPAIIARCAPQPLDCPVSQCVIMVRGRNVDFNELSSRPEIANLIALTQGDFLAGAEEFKKVNGLSVEKFLEDPFLAVLSASEQGDFAVKYPEHWGSAHNTPVNGRFSAPQPHVSKHPKDFEAKNEWNEVPIGPPEAVFSNEQSQNSSLEPHAAVYRDCPTQKEGSFASYSEEEILTDYF